MIEQNILRSIVTLLKEKLDEGVICLPYVKSTSQVADVLTKGLPVKIFSAFCSKMGLYDVFAPS